MLDPASLDVLWYELTHGAYGMVQRAKGIFDLADGGLFTLTLWQNKAVVTKNLICPSGRRVAQSDLVEWK